MKNMTFLWLHVIKQESNMFHKSAVCQSSWAEDVLGVFIGACWSVVCYDFSTLIRCATWVIACLSRPWRAAGVYALCLSTVLPVPLNSPIFSSLTSCSTLGSYLCPWHCVPTHPLLQTLTRSSVPAKIALLHSRLPDTQKKPAGWDWAGVSLVWLIIELLSQYSVTYVSKCRMAKGVSKVSSDFVPDMEPLINTVHLFCQTSLGLQMNRISSNLHSHLVLIRF